MRPEEFAMAIVTRRAELEHAVFATPPQNFEEFNKRLGVWIGLGDALSIIEDARKKEVRDAD